MPGKSPDQNQMNLFRGTHKDFINPQHPLVILADKIPREESEFQGTFPWDQSDLVHHAFIIKITGDSFRIKNTAMPENK